MTGDERYTTQAQEHLRHYIEQQRKQKQKQASDNLLDALRTAASAFSDDNEQDYIEEARQRAHEYAQARNKNLRPVRVVDANNEAAVAGQRSALEFVERRRRSVIRK